MNIEKFVQLRKHLYHLTDESNLESILSNRILKSAETLTGLVNLPDRDQFLRKRRKGHKKIGNDRYSFSLRDQDPLFEKIVNKNLEQDMCFEDFVYLLNTKIFFWAKEQDLKTHYARYEKQNEYPVILRFDTQDLFDANTQSPKFCRLNSGAPRCSSYYPEGAPQRGRQTFLSADAYLGSPSSIREVTFESQCVLPEKFHLAVHPNKSFMSI